MLSFATGDTVPLAIVLDDGATGLYPQAKIYTLGSAVATATVSLVDIGGGRYESSWVAGATGLYTIVFPVYTDAGHTILSTDYSIELEQLEVITSSIADDTSLTRKMLQNRLELADGSTHNWVLYDDNGGDVLLRWDVTGKSGEAISIPDATPAKRMPS